jgi:hypothetical protein
VFIFRAAKAGRGRRRLGPDGLDQRTTGDHDGRVAGAMRPLVRRASMGEEQGAADWATRSDQTVAQRPLPRCQPINPSPTKPTIIIAQVEGSGTAEPAEPPTLGLKTIEYVLASGNDGSTMIFGSNVAEYWPEPKPALPVTMTS